LGEIDRRRVRARFEQRFTAERMAQEYVCHYRSVMEDRSTMEAEFPASAAPP
jgi:hypothetical protein